MHFMNTIRHQMALYNLNGSTYINACKERINMEKTVMTVILACMLAGCGSTAASTTNTSAAVTNTSSASAEPSDASDSESHVLIAWFSRVGNSDFDDEVDAVTGASTNIDNGVLRGNNSYLEEIVERETGADEYFIQVSDLYPGSFGDTVQQFVQEEREDYFHPLADQVENMDQYDTIILIYPTWDSTLPSPVRTFLTSYDFSGKKIYPVNSNDGFGLGDSINRIETYASGAEVETPFFIDDDNLSDLESQLSQYLKEQGLSRNA